VLRAEHFVYGDRLGRAPNAQSVGSRGLKQFAYSFMGPGGIHNRSSILLVKGDSTNCFVAVDPSERSETVRDAIMRKEVARLHMTCYWMDDNPRLQYHVENI
jgi:hypothetical protein